MHLLGLLEKLDLGADVCLKIKLDVTMERRRQASSRTKQSPGCLICLCRSRKAECAESLSSSSECLHFDSRSTKVMAGFVDDTHRTADSHFDNSGNTRYPAAALPKRLDYGNFVSRC